MIERAEVGEQESDSGDDYGLVWMVYGKGTSRCFACMARNMFGRVTSWATTITESGCRICKRKRQRWLEGARKKQRLFEAEQHDLNAFE